MKILIADDQIPDESIPEEKILEVIGSRYSGANPGFINAFAFMRKMVNRLRDSGLEVDTCNEVSQVENMLSIHEYDIAIIDLGWYGDNHIKESERRFKGWEIVDHIQSSHPKLPVIMYSNRFLDNDDIAMGAAERKVLPIYKNYKDTCITNLIAAIKFIEKSNEETITTKLNSVDFETYTVLSKITITLFVVALIFIVIGVSLIFLKKLEVGIMTSVVSIFTSVMSGLFWKYLVKIRKNISS